MTNFTFLKGASEADELVERAKELGYEALAITDECSLAGIVRAHVAAKKAGLPLLVGAHFAVRPRTERDGPFTLVVLAQDLEGYGNLCQFITRLRRESSKGEYHLDTAGLRHGELKHCVALLCPDRSCTDAQLDTVGRWALTHFTGRCWIGVDLVRRIDDELCSVQTVV